MEPSDQEHQPDSEFLYYLSDRTEPVKDLPVWRDHDLHMEVHNFLKLSQQNKREPLPANRERKKIK